MLIEQLFLVSESLRFQPTHSNHEGGRSELYFASSSGLRVRLTIDHDHRLHSQIYLTIMGMFRQVSLRCEDGKWQIESFLGRRSIADHEHVALSELVQKLEKRHLYKKTLGIL
jgi:hypothetical protein